MRHNLSDVGALIRDRRSFAPEQFSSRRVHRDVVEEVLRAGTWAATHGMTQPWRFSVFQGEGLAVIREGLPMWYAAHVGEENVVEKKLEKLRHRLDVQLRHRHWDGSRCEWADLNKMKSVAGCRCRTCI